MTTPLLPEITARLKARAHPSTPTCPCPTTTLADRPDTTVVRHAHTVAKAHAPDTPHATLTPRLQTAAHLPDLFLPPLTRTPTTLHNRLVTFWPYGTPVDPDDPDAAPWEAAATLLARLHRTSPPTPVPPMRGPIKTAHAIARLTTATATASATPAASVTAAACPILRAWHTLPAWARAEAPMPDTTTLCHGDLHLGQLVRHPAPDGPWRLIDVDDLGTGVPAWDLARPAAWYACGLLPPDEWTRFLDTYRAEGGPAVPSAGDPWPALDIPARALTVQTAARAVTKAITEDRPLDEIEMSVIDACARMGSVPPQLPPDSAK